MRHRLANKGKVGSASHMKLILHIGSEITGGAHLQRWLDKNNEELVRAGVFYCESLGRPNNRRLTVVGRGPTNPDLIFKQFQLETADDFKVFLEVSEKEFRQDIERAKQLECSTFVVSNENLHSKIETAAMVARVRSFFAAHFSEIELVVFLRPQVDLMVSRVAINARAGILAPKIRDISPERPYYDYLGLMKRWKRLSGKVSVIPVKKNPDIIASFCELLGLDPSEFADASRPDDQVDYRAAKLSYNLKLNCIHKGSENHNRNFFFDDLPYSEPITISRSEAKELHARFEADNATLIKAFKDQLAESDLTPNFAAYPVKGNIDSVFEPIEVAPVMQYIIVRFNAELWLERARSKAEEALRLKAEHDRAGAASRQAEALVLLSRAKSANLGELNAAIARVEKRIGIR